MHTTCLQENPNWLGMTVYVCNPGIWKVEQEDQEFNLILSYTVSFREAGARWGPFF